MTHELSRHHALEDWFSLYIHLKTWNGKIRHLTTAPSTSSTTLTTNALNLLRYQPPQPPQPTIYIYIYMPTLEDAFRLYNLAYRKTHRTKHRNTCSPGCVSPLQPWTVRRKPWDLLFCFCCSDVFTHTHTHTHAHAHAHIYTYIYIKLACSLGSISPLLPWKAPPFFLGPFVIIITVIGTYYFLRPWKILGCPKIW
jgi:hypothetical protein